MELCLKLRRGTLSGIKGGEYFFDIRNTFFNSTGMKYWEAFLGYQNIKIHDIFMAAAKRTKNSFKRDSLDRVKGVGDTNSLPEYFKNVDTYVERNLH